MKNQPRLFRIIVFLPLFIIIFNSCEKENTPEIKGEYVVSTKFIQSYTEEQVIQQLNLGKLIYPAVDSLIPGVISGIKIFKISYNTSFNDEAIVASGLVCIPTLEGDHPILSFQNGTNTCHKNAPSENISDPLFKLIGLMASHGYILTIPDYLGFGDSDNMLHPYHHKESSNNVIIDLIKAAEEFVNMNEFQITFNGRIFMMGYSQGGWATLNAFKQLESKANEYHAPWAAACGAGAYDLMEMSRHVLSLEYYKDPYYLPYFIESRRQNGILNEPLSLFFNEPYSSTISDLFDGNTCNSGMDAELTHSIPELLTQNILDNFEDGNDFQNLRTELSANSAVAWNTSLKLRFYHSVGDSSVPSMLSEKIYNDFLDEGVSTDLLDLIITQDEVIDHKDAIVPWGVNALLWLNSIKQD